jgi:hypothetical protein
MLTPFFRAAMIAPGRHRTFRWLVVVHSLLISALCYTAITASSASTITTVGYLLLVLGIVEGTALISWRLTQLPKSQALEFLLTSPIQPKRLFLAEMLVGLGRFALVWLSGLPILVGLAFTGTVDPIDLFPLAIMPFVWGILLGLGLTAWVYEPIIVRRLGELCSLIGVLVYLVVGVMAGENLLLWLQALPEGLAWSFYQAVVVFHDMNPFGIVRYWFSPDRVDWIAWERFNILHGFVAALIVAAGMRAAYRLRGHFHDRHYRPIDSSRESQLDKIGDKPLSWWAVRRVMEYSGRVNLWLAGGFSLVYAAYLVAGDSWPSWMGKLVFQLFEDWGGAPAIAAGLVVMAAVPAAFQFGLWDPTVPDRCRRLELLLLTDLTPTDYWQASLAAAWKRGQGYLYASGILWLALALSGRHPWWEVLAAALGGVVVWGFSFAVGFRSFSKGQQTSGMASLLTLGFPILLGILFKIGHPMLGHLLPIGLAYLPLSVGLTPLWGISFVTFVAITVFFTRRGLDRCDKELRDWYDQNQGSKSIE